MPQLARGGAYLLVIGLLNSQAIAQNTNDSEAEQATVVATPAQLPATAPESAADGDSTAAAAAVAPAASEPAPPPPPSGVAAGTTIVIRVAVPVSSTTATQGDFFPIELAEPIMFGDREIVPAGIRGEGQVVHARHRGWGGSAGELILAARYLQWGDRRLPLRAMHLGVAGRDGSRNVALALATVGLVGSVISGRSANVPEGTLATARIAEAIVVDDIAADTSANGTEAATDAPAPSALPATAAHPAAAASTGE